MFKDRLRATRISRKYTAQQMADHLDTGLRNYQKYEGLVSLADLLNVPTDFLLERDEYLSALGVSVDVSLTCPPRRPRPQKNH